jgi:hypothetical protein
MVTMRSIKELLIILRDNEFYFRSGLCGLAWKLQSMHTIITMREFNELDKFIDANRPVIGDPHCDIDCVDTPWYWPIGEWEPREKWLNDHIARLEIRRISSLVRIFVDKEAFPNVIFDTHPQGS